MQRRIIRIIILFIFGFIAILVGGSHYLYLSNNKPVVSYLHFSENKTSLNNQQQGKKEFLDFLTQKKKLSQLSEEVSLVAVGDVSFSRGIERVAKQQNDISYPFLKMGDYLKSADLVFGNLESPITAGREIADFEMVFRSNPDTAQAFKNAGFSIVSLANNHTPNFGEQGLIDTFDYLKKVGIQYVGAGRNEQEANQAVYMEVKGIKFAFLAYNDTDVVPDSYEANDTRAGTAFMRIDKMSESVKEAKQKADFVIISMHSGKEYIAKPNVSQINFSHAAIDAGADMVIGHHPHVVQVMEKYKGKFIFYSLGNFVFDQPWSQATKEGLTTKIYFTKNGISKISFLPIIIENYSQPRAADNDEAEKILQRLEFSLSDRDVYFWNSDDDNFEEVSRATIYVGDSAGDAIVSQKEQADLDNDSIQETYVLENGQLTITEDSKVLWQSSADWWIDKFTLADVNNDRIFDISLSLWKSGDFGTSKPFWVKENDLSVKNHFFVFDFINKTIKLIWGSSNLSVPNCEFKIADIDGDNKDDLVVIEGDYSQKPSCNGNYVAVWKWNGWGFSNEWRSKKGTFSNLEIEKIDGKGHIIVDTL